MNPQNQNNPEDLEDIKDATEELEKIRTGKSKTYTLAEVKKQLDFE